MKAFWRIPKEPTEAFGCLVVDERCSAGSGIWNLSATREVSATCRATLGNSPKPPEPRCHRLCNGSNYGIFFFSPRNNNEKDGACAKCLVHTRPQKVALLIFPGHPPAPPPERGWVAPRYPQLSARLRCASLCHPGQAVPA